MSVQVQHVRDWRRHYHPTARESQYDCNVSRTQNSANRCDQCDTGVGSVMETHNSSFLVRGIGAGKLPGGHRKLLVASVHRCAFVTARPRTTSATRTAAGYKISSSLSACS